MSGAFELALVLAIPFATALLLGLVGHSRGASEINALGSLLTLLAAGMLTASVISGGPMTSGKFRDPAQKPQVLPFVPDISSWSYNGSAVVRGIPCDA